MRIYYKYLSAVRSLFCSKIADVLAGTSASLCVLLCVSCSGTSSSNASSSSSSSDSDSLYAGIILAQDELKKNNFDKAQIQYNRVLELARASHDRRHESMAQMGLGIIAFDSEMNYAKGMNYFLEAAENAQACGDSAVYVKIACNIAFAKGMRADTTASHFARDAYKYASSHHDDYLLLAAAYVNAILEVDRHNFQDGLKYSTQALDILPADTNYTAGVYAVHASALHGLGRDKEAEEWFKRSMASTSDYNGAHLYSCLRYSNYLLDLGRYDEAITEAEAGLHNTDRSHNLDYRPDLYALVAKAYEAKGDWRSAYNYSCLYNQDYSRIFSLEHEQAIADMSARYQLQKKESEILAAKVQLIERENISRLLLVVACALLIIAAIFIILHRRKALLYRSIVRQNADSHKQMQSLRERLAEQNADTVTASVSKLSEDKETELLNAIDRLLDVEKLFRDSTLDRASLAKAVGTNETYISKVVNRCKGMSVSAYINRCRAEYARNLMVDNQDEPLSINDISTRSGFSSMSVFYRSFSKLTGMSPRLYMRTLKQI